MPFDALGVIFVVVLEVLWETSVNILHVLGCSNVQRNNDLRCTHEDIVVKVLLAVTRSVEKGTQGVSPLLFWSPF